MLWLWGLVFLCDSQEQELGVSMTLLLDPGTLFFLLSCSSSLEMKASAQYSYNRLCYNWLIILACLLFSEEKQRRVNLGKREGGGGTRKRGWRGNCGKDVMYERKTNKQINKGMEIRSFALEFLPCPFFTIHLCIAILCAHSFHIYRKTYIFPELS